MSLLVFPAAGVEVSWLCVQGKCSTKLFSQISCLGFDTNAYSKAQLFLGIVTQSAYGEELCSHAPSLLLCWRVSLFFSKVMVLNERIYFSCTIPLAYQISGVLCNQWVCVVKPHMAKD